MFDRDILSFDYPSILQTATKCSDEAITGPRSPFFLFPGMVATPATGEITKTIPIVSVSADPVAVGGCPDLVAARRQRDRVEGHGGRSLCGMSEVSLPTRANHRPIISRSLRRSWLLCSASVPLSLD